MDKKAGNKMDGENEADYENMQRIIKNVVNSQLSIHDIITQTDESVSKVNETFLHDDNNKNQSQEPQKKVTFREKKFQTSSQTDVDAFLKKDACANTKIPNSETDEVVSTEGIDGFVKIFQEIVRITLDEDSKVNKEQVDEIEKETDDKLCTSGKMDNFEGAPLQKTEVFNSSSQDFVECPDSQKTSVSSISKSYPPFTNCGKKSSDAFIITSQSLLPIQLQSQTEAMVEKATSIATATHPKYSTSSLRKINASKISKDLSSVSSGCRIKIVVKSDNHLETKKNSDEFVLSQSAFNIVKKVLVNLSQVDKSQAIASEINIKPSDTSVIKLNESTENSKCNCEIPLKSYIESSDMSNVGQTSDSTDKPKCICNESKVSNGYQVTEDDFKSEIDSETCKRENLNPFKSYNPIDDESKLVSKRENSTITRRSDRYDVRPLRLFPVESRNLDYHCLSDSAVNSDRKKSTRNSKSIRSCCTLYNDSRH